MRFMIVSGDDTSTQVPNVFRRLISTCWGPKDHLHAHPTNSFLFSRSTCSGLTPQHGLV
jgi:hypothetical protein